MFQESDLRYAGARSQAFVYKLNVLHLHSGQMSVGSPSILESLHDGALPSVHDFSGSLAQLQAFAHRADVRTLWIPDAILLRESSPLTISAVLVTAPRLTSLTISFALPHGYDNGGIVRSIASACPFLEHLDFTCACRPAFKFVRLHMPTHSAL